MHSLQYVTTSMGFVTHHTRLRVNKLHSEAMLFKGNLFGGNTRGIEAELKFLLAMQLMPKDGQYYW